MTVAEGKRVNLSRFPNFHRSGSIIGIKQSKEELEVFKQKSYASLCKSQ